MWWGDEWNAFDYGQDFDFSRPFFEQFAELFAKVPRMGIAQTGCENCEYTNIMMNAKNCYLSYASSFSEDVLYSTWATHSKNSMDCLYCDKVDLSYECVDCFASHRLMYCSRCQDCTDCIACEDCIGCQHCYGCHNLNNASYHIDNVAYAPDVYFSMLSEQHATLGDKRKSVSLLGIHRNFFNINAQQSTGDHLLNTKNCHRCFSVWECEDCRYCTDFLGGQKDCIDCSWTAGSLCRECVAAGYCTGSMGTMVSVKCRDALYSDHCIGTSDCFGCIGLRNQSYCILNRQYTREEYEALAPRIIEHMKKTGEWGEFFPASISPFGYNETVAQEYFPIIREDALQQGFQWSDYEAPFPKVDKVIPADKLPETIESIPDDILNWAIQCEVTGKPFRIVKQELDFYRKHKLPIPRRHPDQRHLDRMALRNPRILYARTCDKCGADIETTYVPERPERVYCETCYHHEVYG